MLDARYATSRTHSWRPRLHQCARPLHIADDVLRTAWARPTSTAVLLQSKLAAGRACCRASRAGGCLYAYSEEDAAGSSAAVSAVVSAVLPMARYVAGSAAWNSCTPSGMVPVCSVFMICVVACQHTSVLRRPTSTYVGHTAKVACTWVSQSGVRGSVGMCCLGGVCVCVCVRSLSSVELCD